MLQAWKALAGNISAHSQFFAMLVPFVQRNWLGRDSRDSGNIDARACYVGQHCVRQKTKCIESLLCLLIFLSSLDSLRSRLIWTVPPMPPFLSAFD